MIDGNVYPLEIDVERLTQIRIRWSDDRIDRFPLGLLRAQCPCATCRQERDERRNRRGGLPILGDAGDLQKKFELVDAHLVGRYALRLVWRDGHDQGIWDYGLLRRLLADAGQSPTP